MSLLQNLKLQLFDHYFQVWGSNISFLQQNKQRFQIPKGLLTLVWLTDRTLALDKIFQQREQYIFLTYGLKSFAKILGKDGVLEYHQEVNIYQQEAVKKTNLFL